MSYPDPPGQYSASNPSSGGFPQPPPGQYPPAPQYPGAFGPAPARKPEGRAAIASAVLAFEGALFALLLMRYDFDLMKLLRYTDYGWVSWLLLAVCVIELFTLLPGGVLVLVRRSAGRWLITVGCLVHVALGILLLFSASSVRVRSPGFDISASTGETTLDVLLALVPAILTMILVLLPQTTRWLAWRDPSPFAGQTPFYGTPPGQGPYGPQSYGRLSGYPQPPPG